MPNQTQPKGFDPQLLERQVEHRRDVRHLSVLRIAKLIDGQREVPCLISNVSSGGAKRRAGPINAVLEKGGPAPNAGGGRVRR